MNTCQFAQRIGGINENLIQQAAHSVERSLSKRQKSAPKRLRRIVLIAAALIAALALCGFAVYQFGAFTDDWLEEPSTDPTETVRTALENQIKKEYTIAVQVKEVVIDEAETRRRTDFYSGSELAEYHGWSPQYLEDHFVVVRAKYYVEYDHEKTFYFDGDINEYFYLTQDVDSGEWTIWDGMELPEISPESGFGADLGWLEEPSVDPTEAVRAALENEIKKEYTIAIQTGEITIHEAETRRMIDRYSGGELAKYYGWSPEYLENHFVAVRAKYHVEYDQETGFWDDGDMDRFFYLTQDVDSGEWTIWYNSNSGLPKAFYEETGFVEDTGSDRQNTMESRNCGE